MCREEGTGEVGGGGVGGGEGTVHTADRLLVLSITRSCCPTTLAAAAAEMAAVIAPGGQRC